jgi:hypothetical protein
LLRSYSVTPTDCHGAATTVMPAKAGIHAFLSNLRNYHELKPKKALLF